MIKVGQLYREVDQRFDRHVRVHGFDLDGNRIVDSQTVPTKTGKVIIAAAAAAGPGERRYTFVDPKRFASKSGGYALVNE